MKNKIYIAQHLGHAREINYVEQNYATDNTDGILVKVALDISGSPIEAQWKYPG